MDLAPREPVTRSALASARERDFGLAEYIESRALDKYLLLCRSPLNKDCCYLFQRQSTKHRPDGTYTMYYRCVRCMKISSASPGSVIVKNERITKDPSAGHYEACIPYTDSEIRLLKVKREMRRRVLRDGVRPLQAFREALEELRARVSDPVQLQSLEKEIGQYKHHRSSLYRCAVKHSQITGMDRRETRYAGRRIPPKRAVGQSAWTTPAASNNAQPRQRASAHIEQVVEEMPLAPPQDDELPMAIEETTDQSETVMAATSQLSSPIRPVTRAPPRLTRRVLGPDSRNIRITHLAGGPHIMLNGTLRPIRAVAAMPNSFQQTWRRPPPPNSLRTTPTVRTAAPSLRGHSNATKSEEHIPAKNIVSALSKALDMCRKKSRWETFGDYVGKTLDSLPEENARKAAREVQQILNREQDSVWANSLRL